MKIFYFRTSPPPAPPRTTARSRAPARRWLTMRDNSSLPPRRPHPNPASVSLRLGGRQNRAWGLTIIPCRPQISRRRGPARTRLRFQLAPRPRCGDPQAKTHPRPIGAAPVGQQAFPIRPSKGPEPLKGKRPTAMPFQEVTVPGERSSVPQDWADSGGCPAGGFNRRSVLQGVAVAGLAAVGGNLLGRGAHPNGVAVETARQPAQSRSSTRARRKSPPPSLSATALTASR